VCQNFSYGIRIIKFIVLLTRTYTYFKHCLQICILYVLFLFSYFSLVLKISDTTQLVLDGNILVSSLQICLKFLMEIIAV
jgi:hypothetical protein